MSLAHHRLVAWQRADDFFIDVHRLTMQCFPRDQRYELGTQLRRAAYSVPANIVEGTARETTREKLRFFNIAAASLNETGYGLHVVRRLGYIRDEVYAEFDLKIRKVAAPLNGLIRTTRNQLSASAAAVVPRTRPAASQERT